MRIKSPLGLFLKVDAIRHGAGHLGSMTSGNVDEFRRSCGPPLSPVVLEIALPRSRLPLAVGVPAGLGSLSEIDRQELPKWDCAVEALHSTRTRDNDDNAFPTKRHLLRTLQRKTTPTRCRHVCPRCAMARSKKLRRQPTRNELQGRSETALCYHLSLAAFLLPNCCHINSFFATSVWGLLINL